MSAADLTETRPVGIEDKNAAAHRVGDVDGTALVHCDVGGKPESGLLERKEKLPLRVEFVTCEYIVRFVQPLNQSRSRGLFQVVAQQIPACQGCPSAGHCRTRAPASVGERCSG